MKGEEGDFQTVRPLHLRFQSLVRLFPQVFFGRGDLEQSLKWAESAASYARESKPRHEFLAKVYQRLGRREEALRLRSDHADAIALWLAADIRRESRLGLDIESGDPEQAGETDPTRPDVFPRALYFTQTAGPRYAHLVLERAVKDNDTDVALGAIEALRITAGEASLIGTEDYKQPLVQALHFPDLVVRMRAALTLGAALPKTPFAGSQNVVPVLASALAQTGREQGVVVDSDQANLNRVAGVLRAGDRDAIADVSFYRAMERARAEFQTLSGVFVSSDMAEPVLHEAISRLRGEFIYSKVPVVILVKPQTFMNESGRSVVPLARFYKVRPERLLVVYDDLDLVSGAVRMRPEGGSGGHKGMRSIIEHWGGQNFPRLRIGIGRPNGRMDPAAYVLQDFAPEEKPLLEETLEHAVAAIEVWLREGVEAAMSQYNRSVQA